MATSIRMDDLFVEEARIHAEVSRRSVPKQIQFWAGIGKMVEDNPDLSYTFIQQAILAKAEMDKGMVSKYVCGKRD